MPQLPPPPDQQSAIADTLAGGTPQPTQAPDRSAQVRSMMSKRVDGFIEALAGSPLPNSHTSSFATGHLASALGVDFNAAADQYMKFEKMPAIKQFLLKKLAGHEVSSRIEPYIADVFTNKLPQTRSWLDQNAKAMEQFTQDDAYFAKWKESHAYTKKMLDGLEEVLRDKDLRGHAIKSLLDFHGLAEPTVPFVRSQVTYK